MRRVLVFTIALTPFAFGSVSAEDSDVVRIALRSQSTVGKPLVRMNQIANVQGGKASLRRLISELDVLEFPGGDTRQTINQSQLSLRLQLAGVAKNEYRITGPIRANVSLQKSIASDQRVIETARKALSQHWHVDPSDLEIRLSAPLPAALRTLLAENADLEILPFPIQSQPTGFTRLVMGVYRDQNLIRKVTILLDVQLYRDVAVTNVALHARQRLTDADFRLDRRSVSGRMAMECVTNVQNKIVTRALPAGAILVNKDIRSPVNSGSAKNADVIKRGDIVRLIAHTRGLRVTLRNCQALQNGRVNDVIQVRNPQSRETVTGRVLNSSELEVSF